MPKNPLTELSVTMGTWAWGDSGAAGDGYFGTTLHEDELQEVVDRAQRAGLTLWDTAAVYGSGRSETVLARLLANYDRGDYQLSTKFTPRIAGDGAHPVADMLAGSLDRLRTDYIDLYWIHNRDDVEKWTPQLIPLLEAGTVKQVGVSNHTLADLQRANEILGEAGFRVNAVQNHYSAVYRNSERAGIIDHCNANGIAFFSYMVLEQGVLTGRFGPDRPLPEGSVRAGVYNGMLPQIEQLTDLLAEIGAAHDASAADVATAWAIAKGTVPIVGVTKPKYVDDAVRAAGLALSADDVARIEEQAETLGVQTRGAWEPEI